MVEQRLESVVTRLEALAAKITGEATAAPAKPVSAPASSAASGKDLSGAYQEKVGPTLEELTKAAAALGVDLISNVTAMFVTAANN